MHGISIYFGLDTSLEENIQLAKNAAALGIKRIFTSLQIPETDDSRLQQEFSAFLHTARKENLAIITDISPHSLKISKQEKQFFPLLKSWGVHTIRADAGYSPKEIAAFTRNAEGIGVQLNASTMTPEILNLLTAHDADFSRIDALHNFYPRRNTGLSIELLLEKNALLHRRGIPVSAFIASQNRRRPPLYEGAPTLEMHRNIDVSLASRHLASLGVDSVFIGDSLPSQEELTILSACHPGIVELKIKVLTAQSAVIRLLQQTFTSRIDAAQDSIRTQESRLQMKKAPAILPENTTTRTPGDITIDNDGYLRYKGELQIIKNEQPPDMRVNVAARIADQEHFLISQIKPGQKFRFIFSSL